ncbi:zinc finger protein [Loa loa]|uniref:Zinc finger protein n=1 Tax=Loa loa TaxID=7209 RepID=A0A1S0TME2_LOALO|nr:zinc finger protein [Loa loa]EFO16108.1 zinc finger protein [Loa loa]
MTEGRIGPSALSVIERQLELNEIDQNGAISLNPPIQEVSREQTGTGINQKKIWLKKYQNETSNIQTIRRKQSKGNKGSTRKKHPERSTHTGEKRFKCETCTIGFARSWVLHRHVMIRTGDKPFSCPKCRRGFNQRGNLLGHI